MNFSNPQWKQYLPKSILCLKGYSARIFAADLAAGITVGLVALPLAMAFAIASGLTPQAGIYCAIITGFIISLLGGSMMQIGGPTGAFVVVIAGILAKHGIHGLFLCTMMAGVLLVVMGVTGLGKAVQFIPRPVVMGFTNGIAVLIASTQIRDFFGLRLEHSPSEFFVRMKELIEHASTVSIPATALAALRSRSFSSRRASANAFPATSSRSLLEPQRRRCCICRWRPLERASVEFPPACRTFRFRSFTLT